MDFNAGCSLIMLLQVNKNQQTTSHEVDGLIKWEICKVLQFAIFSYCNLVNAKNAMSLQTFFWGM